MILRFPVKTFVVLFASLLLTSCFANKEVTLWNSYPSYSEPFDIIYQGGNGELNSVQCYIKNNSDSEQHCLTVQEKNKIYDAYKNFNFPAYANECEDIDTANRHLWIRYEYAEDSLSWTGFEVPQTELEKQLKKLENVLDRIVKSNLPYHPPPQW